MSDTITDNVAPVGEAAEDVVAETQDGAAVIEPLIEEISIDGMCGVY